MYKLIFALLFAAGLPLAACAQQTTEMNKKASKTLVAFFSATGTTARAAEKVAAATGGELYAITPERPYTAADLDWRDSRSRSSREMNDPQARPTLGGNAVDAAAYDVIFIGYPIWWDLAPRIVDTFIESQRLTGKTVVPFATSGSSGIGHSAAALKKAYPALDWREGRLLNGDDGESLREWLRGLGY